MPVSMVRPLGAGGHRQVLEVRGHLGGKAARAQHVEPALLGGQQREPLGAEDGHHLLGEGVGDLLEAECFGQCRGHVQQMEQRAGPDGRPGGGGLRDLHLPLLARQVLGQDAQRDAPVVGVQDEGQPPAVRTAGAETCGKTAEERGQVRVLVRGVVQPGQHLPGAPPQQFLAADAQQRAGAGVDEGHTSVEIEAAHRAGQALDDVDRRIRAR
ncbi:hypothetical protein GCM10010512_39300 [Streptomyces thermoviolaceus subsp. thermoviolaceus]|nr:hypothetical protein [Streptomyces thermoviolaceus]GHB03938.1 hypothetical protein GCM10010512_39300 [Streptomyces thermoviolaceus subsp. thermoviolaceus]